MISRILIFLIVILYPCLSWGQQVNHKVVDKNFWMVNGFMVAGTVFNTESSFFALKNCSDCRPDGLSMPLVKSGRLTTYAYRLMIAGQITGLSYELKKNKKSYWWIAPIALGAATTITGGINMKYVF